ncbi:hypothetical protein GCM10027294_40070 [Marinactinospora endophytica]
MQGGVLVVHGGLGRAADGPVVRVEQHDEFLTGLLRSGRWLRGVDAVHVVSVLRRRSGVGSLGSPAFQAACFVDGRLPMIGAEERWCVQTPGVASAAKRDTRRSISKMFKK